MREPARRIWFGAEEPIFEVLPANVVANFRTPRSENALLWNSIYRIAQPAIQLRTLLSIQPLWGTMGSYDVLDDELIPYYWGYNVEGARLEGLDEALATVDGPGQGTEVDLFLVGERHLLVVEAKHTSGFGRCSRYQQGRCPEVHIDPSVEENCRYWEAGEADFSRGLRIGARPGPESEAPLCWRHYQLSRTMLLGQRLAKQSQRAFSLWAIVPRNLWRSIESDWLDFTDRVRDSELWRRMRVLTWEEIERLPAS